LLIPYADTAKRLGMTSDAKLPWRAHFKKKNSILNLKKFIGFWEETLHSSLSVYNKRTESNMEMCKKKQCGSQSTISKQSSEVHYGGLDITVASTEIWVWTLSAKPSIKLREDMNNEFRRSYPAPGQTF